MIANKPGHGKPPTKPLLEWRARRDLNARPLAPESKKGPKPIIQEALDIQGKSLIIGGFPVFTMSAGIGMYRHVSECHGHNLGTAKNIYLAPKPCIIDYTYSASYPSHFPLSYIVEVTHIQVNHFTKLYQPSRELTTCHHQK